MKVFKDLEAKTKQEYQEAIQSIDEAMFDHSKQIRTLESKLITLKYQLDAIKLEVKELKK